SVILQPLYVTLHCVIIKIIKIISVDEKSGSTCIYVEVLMKSDSSVKTERFGRLPGLCRRLKRRRVTVLCNQEKFCWRGLKARAGQVCVCPRGSRCSRFFVHSL
uniref:Cocaine- and amphetamine-regulated transcript protein n=1 Tax=Labrus bergylta TaxID=56723 RepID=A0A3Q3GJC7_9LABR